MVISDGKELVATPFVDDDEGIKSLTRPGGDVPDKRGLGQVHEEVEVIGEVGKNNAIVVFVENFTNQVSKELHRNGFGPLR